MVRFLEIQGPNCREIFHRPLPKQHLFVKKEKKTEGESAPAPEKQSICNFHYGNSTEMGPAGQFVTI